MQVAAVISQPGKPKGRGNKAVPVPTPVEQLARQHLPDTAILCPKSAKEVGAVLVEPSMLVKLIKQLRQLVTGLVTGLAAAAAAAAAAHSAAVRHGI